MKFRIFALSCLLAAPALAETMYIDDTFFAPLRSGEGNQYRIVHKGLKSGTSVEVIRHNKESGYSLVRYEGKIDGWLPTRLLSPQPIARDRVVALEQQIESLRTKLKDSEQKLSSDADSQKSLSNTRDQLVVENTTLRTELQHLREISGNALALDARNKDLQESNQKLQGELELLNAELLRLKDDKDQDFMLVGGGLVLAGVIIAVVLPSLRRTKRSDSWV